MKRHTGEGGLRTPVAAAILVLAMAAMSAAVAQRKTTVVLGTATPGGGFQVYGAAYSAVLNEMDVTLAVEQRSTKGSTENAPLLAEGKIDIGLATGEVTHEALTGIGRPPANVKIINAMYTNSGMFMVRGDSPYRTIADLRGKPIAWGASGSGFVVLARASHKDEAALGAKLEQARESTLANTHAAEPRRDLIHPGVLKYMRED